MKVHMALAVTHYYLGDFTSARQEATSGVRLWHSGVEKSQFEELDEPIIGCLCIRQSAPGTRDRLPLLVQR